VTARDLIVDVLLAVGVGAELACAIGVATMRTVFDRLHYAAAGTTIGPFLILAALLTRTGFTSQGLEAIAAVVILFLANPALVNATARAARRMDYGGVTALPDEKEN
jgi:monovalent cation/proton antiporter MnhG/PhaG subunit